MATLRWKSICMSSRLAESLERFDTSSMRQNSFVKSPQTKLEEASIGVSWNQDCAKL